MASSIATVHPPQTLLEWRKQQNQPEDMTPRQMWTPLEPFFLSQGYTLWVQLGTVDGDAMTLRTPNDEPRAVDPFAYSTPYNEGPPSFDRTLFFTNVSRDLYFFLIAFSQQFFI
jgi:hypothetical protein